MHYLNEAAWRHFWHPVCTRKEIEAATESENRPLAVRLLGENIVVAEIDGRAVAFPDRCLHRSTKLSVGCVESEGLRCAYHGWLYDAEGACIEIPAMPDRPIPNGFRLTRYDAAFAYDLLWVRLDSSAGTSIPGCPPGATVISGAYRAPRTRGPHRPRGGSRTSST